MKNKEVVNIIHAERLYEICNIEKMNADVLESMLMSLNKDYVKLHENSNKKLKTLKHDIATKMLKLKKTNKASTSRITKSLVC